MPPSNNTEIYWLYTTAYMLALSGREDSPSIAKDLGTAGHAALAIGMHDGKANRTPRRLADLLAAVEVITNGAASAPSSQEF